MLAQEFQIRIRGHVPETIVSPETISAGDLAKIVEKVEKAILDTAQSQGVVFPDEPALCVTSIQPGSDVLVWKADPSVLDATCTITSAIREGKFSQLLEPVQRTLHDLWRLAYRRHWIIGFMSNTMARNIEAEITPDSEIPPVAEATGNTTIYGQCIGVGGLEKAKARIRLQSGKNISAKITRKMAKKLAKSLYEEVALEGEATWSGKEYNIVGFKVTKIVNHKQVNLVESFERLRETGGNVWDTIDVEAYLSNLRTD